MKSILSFLFLLLSFSLFAQTDSIQTSIPSGDTTVVVPSGPAVDTSAVGEPAQLLPEHYLLTQRVLWSEHGLTRQFPGMELSEKNRMREVKWRYYMLKAHRFLGYATIAGMVGQALTGIQLYKGNQQYKDLHEGLAAYTGITYFTSGGLMLFAPPWKSDRAPGYSNTKFHKYLAMVHMSCMLASMISADGAEHPGFVRDFHRATAFTAFGTYFISTVVIHF